MENGLGIIPNPSAVAGREGSQAQPRPGAGAAALTALTRPDAHRRRCRHHDTVQTKIAKGRNGEENETRKRERKRTQRAPVVVTAKSTAGRWSPSGGAVCRGGGASALHHLRALHQTQTSQDSKPTKPKKKKKKKQKI